MSQVMRFKTHEGWVIDDAYQAFHYGFKEMVKRGRQPIYSMVDLRDSTIPASGNVLKLVNYMRSMRPANHIYSVSLVSSNPIEMDLYGVLEAAMKVSMKIGPARKFYSEEQAKEFLRKMLEKDRQMYGHVETSYV